VNQVFRCAICVSNRNAIAAAHGAAAAARLPEVRNATTMYSGTALCDGHVIPPQPPRPGQAARQAGLVIPGG
jgi:hypothetical protein